MCLLCLMCLMCSMGVVVLDVSVVLDVFVGHGVIEVIIVLARRYVAVVIYGNCCD